MTIEELDSEIEWLTRTDESCAMASDAIKQLCARRGELVSIRPRRT
jgi:hypothetical protein